MCGFAGLLSKDPRTPVGAAELAPMAQALIHRGPDDGVFWGANGAGLAFRRLSIIDLSGGRQPFSVQGGAVRAVVNGEIYNWRELRAELERDGVQFATESDCEVVPHLYLRHGERFAHKLVGMYAFAIVDMRGQAPRLVLGRDRLGIKPLFFAEGAFGVAFASEPKALLAGGFVPPSLRREALLDYLVQGYIGGEQTAFAGIQRLLPGHVLTAQPGRPTDRTRYWELPRQASVEPPQGSELLDFLDRMVREHMVADVPLGAFLSGGIDSTAVVDSMSRQSSGPVVAWSVGFAEASHDELDVARRTAARLGARHHTEVLVPDPERSMGELAWIFCEPNGDPSCLPTWLVSRMARNHVTVALSGDGGDEIFAGYRRYVHDCAEHRLRRLLGPGLSRAAARLGRHWPSSQKLPRSLRAGTFLQNLGADPAAAYWRSVTPMERPRALQLLHPELADSLSSYDPLDRFRMHYERADSSDPLYRAQYADFHTYLPDQILAKVDRASMGASLEVRVPLLDHRFVERFSGLPADLKVRGGRGKHAFREALRPRIPAEVLDGAKRGFDTPLAAWFRGPLLQTLRATVSELPREWFDTERLNQAVEEHLAQKRDHGRLFWSLVTLDHWRRRHNVPKSLGE